MVAAALWSAEQRYGISVHRDHRHGAGVPSRRPRLRGDRRATGTHLGLFYLDNFARAGKRSGAWATSYRTQHRFDTGATAITSNNNNFVKACRRRAGADLARRCRDAVPRVRPRAARLLQDITLSGPVDNAARFRRVPVPGERALAADARGARPVRPPLPDQAADAAGAGRQDQAAEKFNQGYATVEYLASAIVDMELHTRPDGDVDPDAFEREQLARIGMPREIAMRHRLPQFDHLFASDAYSAGYYSYLWSDVMAADTWRRSSRRVPGTRRSPRACASTSCRPATRSIGPRPIASSAAAIPTSRRCSRSADFLQGSSVARPADIGYGATRQVRPSES